MTALFRRLQPACKFRINIYAIARALKIPKALIVRVECWKHIIFVHRRDCGGQFVSYRRLEAWMNAIACSIQSCNTSEDLLKLWRWIKEENKKFRKQKYYERSIDFLRKLWSQRLNNLSNGQVLAEAAVNF